MSGSELVDDERHMRSAIAEARRNPAWPFGSVLVDLRSGLVVARGVNRVEESPTLHGEIAALNDAAARRVPRPWRDLALYTTAEPCPMCAAAAVWAGLGRIVYGVDIPWLAAHGWYQIDLRAAVVLAHAGSRAPILTGAVLAAECAALFERSRG